MTQEALVKKINAFLASSPMSATAFGKQSVGDPNLMRDLEDGRELRRATREKITAFIKAQPEVTS